MGEACDLYRKAVAAAPQHPGAHLNLGIGLEAGGDADGAIHCFRAALAIDSGDPYANYNLANLLFVRGSLQEAERLLHAALTRKYEFPEAHVSLSNLYDAQGNAAAAVKSLEVALEQRPDYVGALYNYATVLRKLGRLDDAQAALRRAIAADPACVPAYGLLGAILRRQSRIPEAVEVLRSARALAPDRLDVESNLLFTLTFSDDISDDALFAEHKAFGRRLENAHPPRFAPFRNTRSANRPLRIGYVSGDFQMHPVALFTIPLIERHDRSSYEISCYSTAATADEATRRIQSLAVTWRDAASMSDAELADTINRDGIDILVDLSGHSGNQRLRVFAQQPAPVQVSWLGYLNTTGLTRIQYRLSDGYTDPQGVTDRLHTETLIRLPNSQWCYRPFVSSAPSEAPPFKRNGFVTFGSFNDTPKLSRSVLRLWAEILARLPEARLVLVGLSEGQAQDSLLQHFTSAGIAASRITAVPRVGMNEYFSWFNSVDIALDTMPYSGATTTCDALWMGVPVITAPGTRPVSRSSGSILSTVGVSEWIAATPEDYVRLAVERARDQAAITELRGSLRRMMRESPIMDEPRFSRDVEHAYRRMWQSWCDAALRSERP